MYNDILNEIRELRKLMARQYMMSELAKIRFYKETERRCNEILTRHQNSK